MTPTLTFRRLSALLPLLCFSLLLGSCQHACSLGDKSANAPPPHETGRAFLPGKRSEACGYGLYSYLLLGSPPTDLNRERYLKTIAAFLRFVPDIRDLEATEIPIRSLNIAYLPMLDQSEQSPIDPAVLETKGDSPKIEELAQWVLLNYNYPRARAFLNAVPGGPHSSGPYFVSTVKPLTGIESISEQYLYQDLSSVPAGIIDPWVREFITQAGQERFWESRNVAQFALKLRKNLGEFVQASSEARRAWPLAKKELEKLISYKT
jgi:hypothetical protein